MLCAPRVTSLANDLGVAVLQVLVTSTGAVLNPRVLVPSTVAGLKLSSN